MLYKSLNTMAVMASSMIIVSAIYPLEAPLTPDDTILPSPIIWGYDIDIKIAEPLLATVRGEDPIQQLLEQ
jgi:hypothetical protein